MSGDLTEYEITLEQYKVLGLLMLIYQSKKKLYESGTVQWKFYNILETKVKEFADRGTYKDSDKMWLNSLREMNIDELANNW